MPQAVADVIQHLSMLPPFPKVTSKLLGMLNDNSISVDELATVVSADPSLVAKLIHLANSPFYMLSRPVGSVKDAIMVLGVNSIKSITTGLSIQKGFAKVQPRSDVFDMLAFWKHSYATAIVANRLGANMERKASEFLYLSGLIHDVGKIILAYYWPDVWRAIVTTQIKSGEPYHAVESRLCSYSHTYIACELFRRWQFPEVVIDVVAQHHDDAAGTPKTAWANALRRADAVVNAAGHSFPSANSAAYPLPTVPEYHSLVTYLEKELEYQLKVLST